MNVATEAIDRLHSTAYSHHRIILVEVMGHKTGWLTLGAGLAGGADVILIPEIPYSIDKVAEAICERRRQGKHFSIVAVAEGAMSVTEEAGLEKLIDLVENSSGRKKDEAKAKLSEFYSRRADNTLRISKELESMTGLESRVTILGYLQRGGTPSPADRVLATRLGTACATYINDKVFGVMVAARGEDTVPVALKDVINKRKPVPPEHPWVQSARDIGVCFGD